MTTPVAEFPANVDSTMMSAFRGCPRKFYHEFIYGLRPARISIDLHAGACFATAMETLYKLVHDDGLPTDVDLLRTYGVFLKEWGDFEIMKDTPKTRERVWEAVETYVGIYSPHTDHVQPARVNGLPSYEFSFGIPLDPDDGFPLHPVTGSPLVYSGRFDMLGRWSNKLVVRDEKTTTSIGSLWAEQWDLRSQFLGYCWACQQSGLDVDTVVVRGVGILKTKITHVEAIKTYNQFMIERWYNQLRRDVHRMVDMWNEGYFDYNLADSCTSYGGCSFRDLCSSPSPERWYSNYVVRRWNPLHKNPIAEEAKP